MIRDNEFEQASSQFQKWNYLLYGGLLFVLVPAWPVSLRSLGLSIDGVTLSLGINWTIAHVLLSLLSLLLVVDFARKSLTLVKMRALSLD